MLHNLRYTLQLAWRDLRHNAMSTCFIIFVVTSVCLPLLIVSSLREGYVRILKGSIENSTQAKRIDITVSSQRAQEQYLTPSVLNEFKALSGVAEIVPHYERSIYLQHYQDQKPVDFYAQTTIPTDPDLEHFGFSGTFTQEHIDQPVIIVKESEVLKDLGYPAIPETMNVMVTRFLQGVEQNFLIPCKVIGTVKGGLSRRVYFPIPFGKKLERWTLGFGVPEYNLPPAPNREEALGEPTAKTCLIMTQTQLTDIQKRRLFDSVKADVEELPSVKDWFSYSVHLQDAEGMITEMQRQTIEDALSGGTTIVKVIPNIPPITLKINDQSIPLQPALTDDPRAQAFRKKGVWINEQRGRFEVVLPAAVLSESSALPTVRTITIGPNSNKIKLKVVGSVDGTAGYINYKFLYRLQQVIQQQAIYDTEHDAFDVPENNPYEDRFLKARIHVKEIDDIVPVAEYFKAKKYEIDASSETQAKNLQETSKMLRNLQLLVGLAGLIAGAIALGVLMYEAIKRKRNEIGIMRAMGLSKRFITRIFLWEALFYGMVGFLLAIVLFLIVDVLLDTPQGHQLLSIPIIAKDQHTQVEVFSMSKMLAFEFFIGIVLISWIAGRLAAQSARKVDPADILSGN